MKRVAGILPSKKFGVWLLVAVLFVGTAYFFSRTPHTEETSPFLTPPEVTPDSVVLLEDDADNDGLKDWEETLWQTDPLNADTDGDTTPDGEEVAAGRHPAIPGPDDALNQALNSELASSTLSTTNILGQTLFSEYITLRNKGVTFDEDTSSLFIENLLGGLSTTDAGSVPIYTSADIVIETTASETASKTYGNTLATLLNTPASASTNELIALQTFAQTGDIHSIGDLAPVIAHYDTTINSLLNLPTPTPFVEEHLALIQGLARVRTDVEGIHAITDDPLTAFLALSSYKASTQTLRDALRALSDEFVTQAVVFSSSEAGHLLIYTP